ncbi:hypothetical protein GQ457_06G003030 [Hibiscus cannabinus]
MAMVLGIDFSKKQDLVKPGSLEWNSVKLRVPEALEEYGCFEALFNRVVELRKPVFRASEELFDIHFQTKKHCVSEKPFRGYYGTPPPGLFESISVDDGHVVENIEQPLTVKLPVIDFSEENLKPGSSAWASACTDVRRALEECGCFEAKFEKMHRHVRDAAFVGAEELFGLPTEVKLRNTNDKPGFHYFGQFEFMPLYESLAVENPTSFDATSNFTRLMWPDGNDRFRESAQSYSELVTELDRTVARMLFESYGVGYYYDYYSKNTTYLLRYFSYTEPMLDQTNAGILPHTDKTFFSIIHQGDISGLMVKVKDDRWVDVPPSPTSFVVMAGDALMVAHSLPSFSPHSFSFQFLSELLLLLSPSLSNRCKANQIAEMPNNPQFSGVQVAGD